MPVETTTADAAVLEIERFEWAGPDRIEIVGYWSGLRGRRFMRPTLVLRGEGPESKRLLAVLDHKPWAAGDGEQWVAAFPWVGDVVRFDSAEMNVGSGIDLELPPPRMRPGKPRRFRQRVVARDASRDVAATPPRATGVVSDAPAPVEADAAEAEAPPKKTSAPAKKREPTAPAASTAKQADAPAAADAPTNKPDASSTAVDQEPTQALPAGPDEPTPAPTAELNEQLAAKTAEADRLRTQRDSLRKERDQALEKLRTVRGALEGERQSREKAIADARAEERESANRMLGEGAELRAAVERQREIAYLERDDANTARDKAVAQREKACEERDAAQVEAKEARRERKEALAQRDRATKLAERAEATRDQALREREDALAERHDAVRERDEIKSVHDRGLPLKPPKPRFLPEDHEQRSELDIWGPRVSALGVLLLCAFIVLRLFACG
jgi:hypothetical protein